MDYAIRAEMVASVHSVVVEAGGSVTIGDTLMILESMKMEIPVESETAGSVEKIHVEVGSFVNEEETLITLAE